MTRENKKPVRRHPEWLKVRIGKGESQKVRRMLKDANLHTVCQSAACPNIGECFDSGTATFLIMGDTCTRNCRFCNIAGGRPQPLDADEPRRVAESIAAMSLQYAVVTSVTRDDLADGGAAHFADTIEAIRSKSPDCRVEVLIPDLRGDEESLMTVLAARPDVLNHNVETVPRIYDLVRPGADYARSLELLERSAKTGAVTKSGLMVGIGERIEEIKVTIKDIFATGTSIITIGQYLQPSKEHLPVERYVLPEEFAELGDFCRQLGFRGVESAPLVRSSYHAASTSTETVRPVRKQ
jgi:lipoic acid synthetase